MMIFPSLLAYKEDPRIHLSDCTLALPRKQLQTIRNDSEGRHLLLISTLFIGTNIDMARASSRLFLTETQARGHTHVYTHSHTIKHLPNFWSAAEAKPARSAKMVRNRWNDSILPITRPSPLVINPFQRWVSFTARGLRWWGVDGDGVEKEGEMGERVKKERRRQAYAKPESAHRSPRDSTISTEQQPSSDVTDTRAHKWRLTKKIKIIFRLIKVKKTYTLHTQKRLYTF